MRGTMQIDGEWVVYGYFSVLDWVDSVIESFPSPWSVAELDGKYYGTGIKDSTGHVVLRLWHSYGEPSVRQKGDMDDEQWSEYCCDSHWESEVTYSMARTIIAARNAADGWDPHETKKIVRSLVLQFTEWQDEAWSRVRPSGSGQRALPSDPKIRARL